jgi:CO/xanthine dehydrogenase Mo-binding subunit
MKSSSLHSALTQIGDAHAILNAAGNKVIETRYHTPYQVHATVEPVVVTVRVRDGKIEVWGPIQGCSVQRWPANRCLCLYRRNSRKFLL